MAEVTRADLLEFASTLREDLANAMKVLTTDLHAVKLTVTGMEARMEEVGRLERELEKTRDQLQEVDREVRDLREWRAGFSGEKGQRDKDADASDAMWRRILAGLLVAAIVAFCSMAWATFTRPQIDPQLLIEALQSQPDADP